MCVSLPLVQGGRKHLGIAWTEHRSLADIDLPSGYRCYEVTEGNSDDFLLGDTQSGDPDRILPFGGKSAASWIGNVQKLYVNETFSVSPELFPQLVVILAERPTCVAQWASGGQKSISSPIAFNGAKNKQGANGLIRLR